MSAPLRTYKKSLSSANFRPWIKITFYRKKEYVYRLRIIFQKKNYFVNIRWLDVVYILVRNLIPTPPSEEYLNIFCPSMISWQSLTGTFFAFIPPPPFSCIFILPLYFPVLPYISVFFFFLKYVFFLSHILPPDDISWYPPPPQGAVGIFQYKTHSWSIQNRNMLVHFVSLLILSLIIRPIYSSVTKKKYGPEVWKGKKTVLFITHGQQARILLRILWNK